MKIKKFNEGIFSWKSKKSLSKEVSKGDLFSGFKGSEEINDETPNQKHLYYGYETRDLKNINDILEQKVILMKNYHNLDKF